MNAKRIIILGRYFLPVLALAAVAGGPCRAAADGRPNLLFIIADQWRAKATGYNGDPNVKTPHLDRLAAACLNFRNAVSVCPVCTPYRAALMTGRFPTTTGMFLNDLYLPAQELCMGEIFRTAGYATGYIGKWHLDGHGRGAYIPPERRHGFEYWKAAECDHNYLHSHYYTGTSPEKQFWSGYDAFAETADAQQYLRDHAAGGRPFLLVVSFGPPHFPHNTAPEEYKALYPPEKTQLPPNVPDTMKDAARREATGYYAHCTAIDRCVGDLLATLDQTHLAGRTIVVFTSDHGEMLGSQGGKPFLKQVPWDESAHVPLLLRDPAAAAPARQIAMPITTPDLLPTLLGLTGVAKPATIQGEDLSAVVRGTRPDGDRAVLYMNPAPFDMFADGRGYRAVRTSRYTYVRSVDGPWLFYDDRADPYQMHNLLGQADQAAVQQDLDGRLAALLKRIGDEFHPKPWYLEKWGYEVNKVGAIPYNERGDKKVQSPGGRGE